jgi:hypothetical protein
MGLKGRPPEPAGAGALLELVEIALVLVFA